MKDTETQILNLGPKLVPPAPQQVLKRLPKQIEQMKDKVAAASRTVTKTIGRQSPLVNKFCQRVEVEIRKRIATEALRDPTFEPAINYFQKMQKHKKIIFRQADKSKVFHADIREKYIEKSTAYMRETNAYIEIPTSPLVKIASFSDKNIPPLFDNHTPYSISNSITFPKHLKCFGKVIELEIEYGVWLSKSGRIFLSLKLAIFTNGDFISLTVGRSGSPIL
ncbi:unnamed protein product [Rotaria sp. Silwood1]|nr:unnamed protein product [Rotaria sp. Silwood1]